MVEFLLFLSPMCGSLTIISMVSFVVFVIMCIFAFLVDDFSDEKYNNFRLVSKRYLIVSLFAVVIFGGIAESKEGIINVYGYRAATSNTAEKAIETLNTVLDKVNESVKNK